MGRNLLNTQPQRKKIGLVLGSGAARGWAHIGVLNALDELGIKPDIYVGCSVGAVVAGAHLVGALPALEAWAGALKPLSAWRSFAFKIERGGLVDVSSTFDAFRSYDRPIEELSATFAAVATDLGTGAPVVISEGSTIEAIRASSAIPVLFHAVRREDRWMADGALANPLPVDVARDLGADIVIAVDLNGVPRVLDRFDPPENKLPAEIKPPAQPANSGWPGAISKLIADTQTTIERQLAITKARALATPQLVETFFAATDIFQLHMTEANLRASPADMLLRPDMRDASAMAFDQADELKSEGYEAVMTQAQALQNLFTKTK